MGEVTHWNWPFPGMVKVVSGCDFSSSFICRKPKVRSKVEKKAGVGLSDMGVLV